MNKVLEEKIRKLSLEASLDCNKRIESYLESAEFLLKEELKKDPKDTELWIRLAMLEYNPPWRVPTVIIGYLNRIFEYDFYHPEAVLIMAYTEDLFYGEISDKTFDQLLHVKSDDSEIMGMIEIAKAWYYRDKDEDLYEKCLKKSIEYAPNFLAHYIELGKFYFERNKRELGRKLIKKGLQNINKIYVDNSSIPDFTDVNEFYNEFYKRTHQTDISFESDKRWLTEENPSDTITFFR